MDDTISRQAAIDAVDSETVSTNPEHFKSNEKFIKFMDDSDISSFGRWQWANGFNTALVATRIQLKKLPSARPVVTDICVGDTISRQAALEKVRTMQTYKLFMGDDMILVDKAEVQTDLMMLPSVQPEPQEGEWIPVHPLQDDDSGAYMCSKCKTGMWEIRPSAYHYCPNCGEKMKGVENGESV